ncbi:hypothetical protein LTR56_005633 [Elasticomyces elasticus]|nr:hypothetical protein LTR56_005633 [Elasticomyces elasticus]KAK3663980.1 hypothetical protein LTR22_005200 [Elasticomyces elasticus]KAK4927374.1 hypothetical protein LTR49_005779 [Elasticomyces elasticus]KAK5763339.1 hypothetical protein LTS12_006514 [Elasticomyces elasticus]
MDLAKFWLERCKTSHTTCESVRDQGWRPSRLLHWSSALEETLVLHLAEEEDYGYDVTYLTLSHRWLGYEQMKLQTFNSQSLREHVHFDRLKAAIQDALKLAQHLGYNYLWYRVDLLCILQNDAKDRSEHIAQMHKVYSNSICNIAAFDAANASEGCFYVRDKQSVQPFRVSLDGDSSDEARHIMRPSRLDTRVVLQDCLLNERAWVLQERVLAPRTVHCCRTQLYWECRAGEASETWPNVVPSAASGGDARSFTLNSIFSDDMRSSSRGDAVHRAIWHQLVQDFCRRSLTYPEDKLRAFEGISEAWRSMHGGEYLFGLWRDRLPGDLLWGSRGHEGLVSIAPDQFVAPSWSWASVDGHYRPPTYGEHGHFVATVDSIRELPKDSLDSIASSGQGTTSAQCESATLYLHGHVVQLRCFEHKKGVFVLAPCTDAPSQDWDTLVYEHSAKDILLDNSTQPPPDVVTCIPIWCSDEHDEILGLVLTPTPGNHAQFQRLGIFEVHSPARPSPSSRLARVTTLLLEHTESAIAIV